MPSKLIIAPENRGLLPSPAVRGRKSTLSSPRPSLSYSFHSLTMILSYMDRDPGRLPAHARPRWSSYRHPPARARPQSGRLLPLVLGHVLTMISGKC
jgi:hypothetical protein